MLNTIIFRQSTIGKFMNNPINVYGDRLSPTTGKHGSNISAQRLDKLDQACLAFVKERAAQGLPCQAIDIGAGSGDQSQRMAQLGATVFMIDLTDQSEAVAKFNTALGREALRFIQKDVREMTAAEWPEAIDCVYSQRMLGAVRYAEALGLLTTLVNKSSRGAQYFLSASGYNSEYQKGYPDRDKPVEERWPYLILK